MENIGGDFPYEGNAMDFPPSDSHSPLPSQLMGVAGHIPGPLPTGISVYPPPLLHIPYSHLHDGEAVREGIYSHHNTMGQSAQGLDALNISRLNSSAISSGSRASLADYSSNLTRPRQNPSNPNALPHMSSFSERMPMYMSNSSQISSPSSVLASSYTTSVISSSAHIPAYLANQQAALASQASSLVEHARSSSSYTTSLHGHSHFSSSRSLPNSNSLPSPSEVSGLNLSIMSSNVNSARESTPSFPASSGAFSSVRRENPSSSNNMPSSVSPRRRPANCLPVENLDGDQKVPNAIIMSPSSGCSSPSTFNNSSAENLQNSLLRQSMQAHVDSNLSNMANGMNFANTTYVGQELCSNNQSRSNSAEDPSISEENPFQSPKPMMYKKKAEMSTKMLNNLYTSQNIPNHSAVENTVIKREETCNVRFLKLGRLECCREKKYLHKGLGRIVVPIAKLSKQYRKSLQKKRMFDDDNDATEDEKSNDAIGTNSAEDNPEYSYQSRAKMRKISTPNYVESKTYPNSSKGIESDSSKDCTQKADEEELVNSLLDFSVNHSRNVFGPVQGPYAMTSPSFNMAAAKAIMTTTTDDKGSVITISIMGKGTSKTRGKTKTVNINHPDIEDNIEHIRNNINTKSASFKSERKEEEDEDGDDEEEDEDNEEGSSSKPHKSLAMSKTRKKKASEDGDDDEEEEDGNEDEEEYGETMEVNIRINDSQYVPYGDEGQKRWQCHKCPKAYTTKHNLITHVLDHEGIKPHLCMVCGKYFKQLSHLNTHLMTHDKLRPFLCEICHKGFTQVSHLKRHLSVHMDNKPHICNVCGRGFAYPSELKIHKEKHTQGKDQCPECEVTFDNQRSLKLHMLKHENREDLICKYCDKPFRYPSQLKDHLISHEGARPYMCTECGMDFMKDHHLRAHLFTHTGQKPHICEICGRSFNQRANMMRHMLIHNPDKNFKCEECGKSFSQPQTLKAHMVVHQDSKPYKCKLCGKQFGRLHNLQGHMHIHNNSKPFICFCGSSFTLRGNLNRHKKVKHGLNESTESMEEEAVHFLSSLSERSMHTEGDRDDLEEGDSEPENRGRKGRKSVPRQIIKSSDSDEQSFEKNQEEMDPDKRDKMHVSLDDIKQEFEHNVSRYFQALNAPRPDLPSPSTSFHNTRKRKPPMHHPMSEESQQGDNSDGAGETEEEEDMSDSEWTPTKKNGMKGDKLNSLIAEKFQTK